MTELTLAWAALFGFRAGVYAVLIATGRVGWLAAASVAMGWPAFGLLLFASYRFVPQRLEQLGAPDPRHNEPEPDLNLERPVEVVQSPCSARSRVRSPGEISVLGRTRTSIPSAASTSSARSAIAHLAERGRVHVVGHHQVAGAEVAQVEHERPVRARRAGDDRVGLLDRAPARGRPRSSGIVTTSTRSQRAASAASALAWSARERFRIPVGRAHVVDARVQAADVVARVRAGGARLSSAGTCSWATCAARAPSTA